MQGLFRKISPFTPATTAVASVFSDCPAMVVPYDHNGTVSTFRSRVGVQEESPVRVVSTLNAHDPEFISGDTKSLEDDTIRLMDLWGGEFAVLIHGPVSAVVGTDLEDVAEKMTAEHGIRVMAVDVSPNAPYDEGLSKAMLTIMAQLGEREPETTPSTLNLLGLNCVDHNDIPLRELLYDRVQAATGSSVVSVWGSRDCWSEWEQARNASENIVMSIAALKAARAMKDEWGIPFRRIDELGMDFGNKVEAVSSALRVLVISEQLMGNVARQLLEEAGCDVTVASFHTLAAAAKKPGDFKLKSEGDLTRTFASGDWDVVVCDPNLCACLPQENPPAFIPLKHAAVARNIMQSWDVVTPFSDEWFEEANRVLGELA